MKCSHKESYKTLRIQQRSNENGCKSASLYVELQYILCSIYNPFRVCMCNKIIIKVNTTSMFYSKCNSTPQNITCHMLSFNLTEAMEILNNIIGGNKVAIGIGWGSMELDTFKTLISNMSR